MKRLLLVRHAKSSWDKTSLNDFDRPLNDRGKKDAQVMARRLVEKKISIDAFISSPARRAKKTAEAFLKEYESDQEIIFEDDLYVAGLDKFNEVISRIKNRFETVAIFSHNPGITEYANTLTVAHVDEMPTCSIFAVTIDTNNWADLKVADKAFWFFDSPKAED